MLGAEGGREGGLGLGALEGDCRPSLGLGRPLVGCPGLVVLERPTEIPGDYHLFLSPVLCPQASELTHKGRTETPATGRLQAGRVRYKVFAIRQDCHGSRPRPTSLRLSLDAAPQRPPPSTFWMTSAPCLMPWPTSWMPCWTEQDRLVTLLSWYPQWPASIHGLWPNMEEDPATQGTG